MDELLNEALKHYKNLQQNEPDNLSLPKFHKAMQALIDRSENEVNVEAGVMRKTEDRSLLINFLDDLREYMRESCNNIGFDERENEEFVDIFLSGEKLDPNFSA
ncbi:MAG: hypothetical protein A2V66_16820 [Ignavibacteria bacterium RBG_13_36_8]|nr:MAG: hypothetical protein A2V66_16820 [Ignavibacteria bacterium RBG_13_36_8]